jgi:hypothetical protein
MLRAQKFNGSPHGPRRIADPQNVEGNLLIASVQNVQTVRVVKNEGSDLKSLSIQRPGLIPDGSRTSPSPREVEGWKHSRNDRLL